MKIKDGEIASSNVNEHLFRDESSFQEKRIYVYCSLIAFTVLLVVTFLFLNAGLAFALTCGVSIGISFSMLILALMRIGSKSFWFYFAWFLAVLLGFSYFGLPSGLTDGLEKIGISNEIMILGSLFQVAIFFVYVAYVQCKDFGRKPLNIDSELIRIEKNFTKKKSVKKKVRKKVKGKEVLKKLSFNKDKVNGISENFEEPEVFANYRKLVLKAGFCLTALSALVLVLFSGISYLMPFTFISMFIVTLLLITVPMIKPGTNKFWYSLIAILLVIIPIFTVAVN